MFKKLLILCCLLQAASARLFAQSLSPDASTAVCPNTGMTYEVQGVSADVLSIQSSTGFTTITSGIDPSTGDFAVTVIIPDAPASFVLFNSSTQTSTTYKINSSTLKGVTPAFNPPSPRAIGSFVDVISVPLCSTSSFSYTGPFTFYQYNGMNSGTGMTAYDWLVPKGWAVNGAVSNGTTPITAELTVTLTPNVSGGGSIQFWALNNCNPALTGSNKVQIGISRTVTAGISVNGSTTTTVTCGQANPVTFNVTGTPPACVSGYQWSSPSGWLDASGAAVTSTVTTTPSLTLTPVPSTAPSSVTVTLMVNGAAVTGDTYTETVLYSATPPSTTISGTTQICGPGPFTFAVAGLTSGSSASTFTVTPINFNGSITQSTSGNTLTITNPGGSAYGTLQISASTVTPCGTSVTPIQPVLVGQPPPSIRNFINGEMLVGPGPFTFNMLALSSDPIIGWAWTASPHVTISGQNTGTVTFTTPHLNSGQSGSVSLTLQYETAACGWSATGFYSFIDQGSGVSGFPPPFVRTGVAANEVDIVAGVETVTDATSDGETTTTTTATVPGLPVAAPGAVGQYTIKAVNVYNTVGQLKKKVVFGGNNPVEHLVLNDQPSGIYFLQILTSKGMVTLKYLVQH
jgi:hypothetical protein